MLFFVRGARAPFILTRKKKKKKHASITPNTYASIPFYLQRIDLPVVNVSTASGATVKVAKVRFNCLRSLYDPVHLSSIELRVKQVPWE